MSARPIPKTGSRRLRRSKTIFEHAIPISIGSSHWIAQTIAGGMVEFLPDFNNFAPDIPYPEEFKKYETRYGNRNIISCKYKGDCIVIINAREHCGIVFDTRTREFSEKFIIRVERWSLCVVIGNYLHIKRSNDYTILSLTDKTQRNFGIGVERQVCEQAVITFDDLHQSSNKTLVAGFARNCGTSDIPVVIIGLISKFTKFEFVKFGGQYVDSLGKFPNQDEYVDSFYIGTLKNGNPAELIDWQLAPQYTLKHPMYGFGYIHYGPYIVTFGGKIPGRRRSAYNWRGYKPEFTDNIYILDLRRNCGWTKSAVKCPRSRPTEFSTDAAQKAIWYSECTERKSVRTKY